MFISETLFYIMQLVKYLTLLVIIAWAASNGQKCHREIK